MRRDDGFIAALEDYLVGFDGETPLPEYVRDAVQAALPRTPQARPIAGRWRGMIMNARLPGVARLGMVTAAVVVVVAVGALLLGNIGRSSGVAGRPTAAPSGATPSAAPSASASPTTAMSLRAQSSGSASCPKSGSSSGCLVAGTYRLDDDVTTATVTMEIPAGWAEWEPGRGSEGLLVDNGPDARDGSGWGLLFSAPSQFLVDPCKPNGAKVRSSQVGTLDQVAEVMASWPGFTASAPTRITVDGFDARLVELSSTRRTADCPATALWVTTSGSMVDAYPMVNATSTRPTQYRIVNIGSGPFLIIRATDYAQTSPFEEDQGVKSDPTRHAGDQAGLRAILNSIRISSSAP
jgi:hypothetical protein